MLARYTTTYADFKHAQRLHVLRKPFGYARYAFVVWILPVLGAVAAGLIFWDSSIRHFQLPPWLAGVLAGTGWLGLFTAVYRPFLFRRAHKRMKNGRADTDPLELELIGDEIISRVPGRSAGHFFRTAVDQWIEDDQLLLVYVSKRNFLLLPKREFAASDLTSLRAWLARSGDPLPASEQ